MWPDPLDAVEQTVAAETVIEYAYDAALSDWAPHARAAVVPAGQYGIEFEPTPDAVSSVQARWDEALALWVLPEVAELWERAMLTAVEGLGLEVDDPVKVFAAARDDYLDAYRLQAAKVPATIRDDLTALITEQKALTASLVGDLRSKVTKALTGGSELLSRSRRRLGFQASSVLNNATMATAKHAAGDQGPTRKQWVAILDEKTRDTHWAADGQVAPLDGNFSVGGVDMAYPGDPSGPAREVINCRCRLGFLRAGEKGRHRKRVTASADKETEMTVLDDQLVVEAPQTYRTFTDATVAFIGVNTSDYRRFADDAVLEFRTPPLPLMWKRTTGEGHDNSCTVGVIEEMRAEDGKVLASGYMLNTPDADEAMTQLDHGVTRPSVDLGQADWETLNEAGEPVGAEEWWDLKPGAKTFTVFTSAEFIAVTLVATPAFGDTKLSLNTERAARDPGLVAAARADLAPRVWPAGFFTDPKLTEPTLPTMTDDGRVYGHVACWGTCHRSVQRECTYAPRSPSNYTHFHTSPAVRLDDDTRLPVGRLTVGTGHADDRLSGIPAAAHYDNTGACWALVRVGEDAHGIWFSGVPAPWATPEQVEAGLAAPLSGDWRDFGEGLDLVAALSVNTPGFTIRGRSDSYGRPVALVAALGPAPDATRRELTREEIAFTIREAVAAQFDALRFETERDAALARAAVLTRPLTPREEIGAMLDKLSGVIGS